MATAGYAATKTKRCPVKCVKRGYRNSKFPSNCQQVIASRISQRLVTSLFSFPVSQYVRSTYWYYCTCMSFDYRYGIPYPIAGSHFPQATPRAKVDLRNKTTPSPNIWNKVWSGLELCDGSSKLGLCSGGSMLGGNDMGLTWLLDGLYCKPCRSHYRHGLARYQRHSVFPSIISIRKEAI